MRLRIIHTTEYRYDDPVHYSLQRLRLTPQSGPGQTVRNWKIEVDGAKVEAGFSDQFGNRSHLVSMEGESHRVHIVASGEVDTEDRAGVYGLHQGFVPLWLYLRSTPRTQAGARVAALVESLSGDNDLARMHELMDRLHTLIRFEPGSTGTETTAEQALEAETGVCQDHAHALIAAARMMGLPARYISGYLLIDGTEEQSATHAWAEVHLPGLGWVGFDAANNHCPDERYIRLACGLCYADAAPVSGLRFGLAGENLTVTLRVEQASQSQSQSQS